MLRLKELTLARKLDVVHKDTVINNNVIPRVRRARPLNNLLGFKFVCKLLL